MNVVTISVKVKSRTFSTSASCSVDPNDDVRSETESYTGSDSTFSQGSRGHVKSKLAFHECTGIYNELHKNYIEHSKGFKNFSVHTAAAADSLKYREGLSIIGVNYGENKQALIEKAEKFSEEREKAVSTGLMIEHTNEKASVMLEAMKHKKSLTNVYLEVLRHSHAGRITVEEKKELQRKADELSEKVDRQKELFSKWSKTLSEYKDARYEESDNSSDDFTWNQTVDLPPFWTED